MASKPGRGVVCSFNPKRGIMSNPKANEYPTVPFHPETGLPAAHTEKARNGVILKRLESQAKDEAWLAEDRPFVPKDLDEFRASAAERKKAQVRVNLGEAMAAAMAEA